MIKGYEASRGGGVGRRQFLDNGKGKGCRVGSSIQRGSREEGAHPIDLRTSHGLHLRRGNLRNSSIRVARQCLR